LRAKQVAQTSTAIGIHHAGGGGAVVKSLQGIREIPGNPEPGRQANTGETPKPGGPLSAAAGSGERRYRRCRRRRNLSAVGGKSRQSLAIPGKL